jgi:hypothetical protein
MSVAGDGAVGCCEHAPDVSGGPERRRFTAAHHDHIAGHLRIAGLGALADLGFTGLDPDPDNPVIITGYKSTRGLQGHIRSAAGQPGSVHHPRPPSSTASATSNWRTLTPAPPQPARSNSLL